MNFSLATVQCRLFWLRSGKKIKFEYQGRKRLNTAKHTADRDKYPSYIRPKPRNRGRSMEKTAEAVIKGNSF